MYKICIKIHKLPRVCKALKGWVQKEYLIFLLIQYWTASSKIIRCQAKQKAIPQFLTNSETGTFFLEYCCCWNLLRVCKLTGYVQGEEIVAATNVYRESFLLQKVLMWPVPEGHGWWGTTVCFSCSYILFHFLFPAVCSQSQMFKVDGSLVREGWCGGVFLTHLPAWA